MALNLSIGQARRAFVGILGGAALLAIAGCQTTRGPGPYPNGPLNPLGVGENEGPKHLVAVIVPLTGNDAGVGTSIANAARLALLDTGDKSVRIDAYDSAGAGGAAAAARHALSDGAGLILGPLLAADVRAAAPVARSANVPVIAFSNDTSVAGGGVYIMGVTPDQSIALVIDHSRSTGAARFGALVPSGLYGQRASAAILGAVRRSGGLVSGLENYDRSAASVASAARRLRARGASDAVIIADSGRIAALAAPSLGGMRILGTELWASDRALGLTPALRGAMYAAAPDARFNQLTGRYRARYGKVPYRLGSLGYDAMLLVARAAPGWSMGRPFPAKSLIDKDGFAGVDGNFRFRRDGIAERLLEVRQVTATGTTVVAKAATAF